MAYVLSVNLPPGGHILPYFKDSRGRWKVVLVNQYREAVGKKTIEAPGGRIENREKTKTALSRELKEETGIKVNPKLINIVFYEYLHPPVLNISVFGALVKISQKMVKNKNKKGNANENESTQVELYDLANLLKKREAGKIKIDLMTSRLLDEIAKAVGLLVKKY